MFGLQLAFGMVLVPCLDLDHRAGILTVFAMHAPFAGAAENRGKIAHLDLHLLGRLQSQEHEAWANANMLKRFAKGTGRAKENAIAGLT